MTSIYVWGNITPNDREKLHKELKLKWSKKKRKFYRQKADKDALKKIMNYCMKKKFNYKTDDGQSYEVIKSDFIETSTRELKEWGANISKGTPYLDEVDYQQMWDEHH